MAENFNTEIKTNGLLDILIHLTAIITAVSAFFLSQNLRNFSTPTDFRSPGRPKGLPPPFQASFWIKDF